MKLKLFAACFALITSLSFLSATEDTRFETKNLIRELKMIPDIFQDLPPANQDDFSQWRQVQGKIKTQKFNFKIPNNTQVTLFETDSLYFNVAIVSEDQFYTVFAGNDGEDPQAVANEVIDTIKENASVLSIDENTVNGINVTDIVLETTDGYIIKARVFVYNGSGFVLMTASQKGLVDHHDWFISSFSFVK